MDPDRADPATLLTGLHDIRLPPTTPLDRLAEISAALAVGLLLALLLAPLLKALTTRRPGPTDRRIAARLAAVGADPDRQLALLRLLADVDPAAARAHGGALYRRDGLPDAARLEAQIRERST